MNMIEKIKKLAQSPAIGSDLDIKNFAKVMELSDDAIYTHYTPYRSKMSINFYSFIFHII